MVGSDALARRSKHFSFHAEDAECAEPNQRHAVEGPNLISQEPRMSPEEEAASRSSEETKPGTTQPEFHRPTFRETCDI